MAYRGQVYYADEDRGWKDHDGWVIELHESRIAFSVGQVGSSVGTGMPCRRYTAMSVIFHDE